MCVPIVWCFALPLYIDACILKDALNARGTILLGGGGEGVVCKVVLCCECGYSYGEQPLSIYMLGAPVHASV